MNLPFKTLPELLQYFDNEGKSRNFLEKMRRPRVTSYVLSVGLRMPIEWKIVRPINAEILNVKQVSAKWRER